VPVFHPRLRHTDDGRAVHEFFRLDQHAIDIETVSRAHPQVTLRYSGRERPRLNADRPYVARIRMAFAVDTPRPKPADRLCGARGGQHAVSDGKVLYRYLTGMGGNMSAAQITSSGHFAIYDGEVVLLVGTCQSKREFAAPAAFDLQSIVA